MGKVTRKEARLCARFSIDHSTHTACTVLSALARSHFYLRSPCNSGAHTLHEWRRRRAERLWKIAVDHFNDAPALVRGFGAHSHKRLSTIWEQWTWKIWPHMPFEALREVAAGAAAVHTASKRAQNLLERVPHAIGQHHLAMPSMPHADRRVLGWLCSLVQGSTIAARIRAAREL